MRRRLAAALVALLVVFGIIAVPQAAHAEPDFVLDPDGVVSVEHTWGLWTISKAFGDPMDSMVVSGALPPGLDLADSWDPGDAGGLTTRLHGTPTTPGYYEFEVGVVDGGGQLIENVGTKTWGITVVDIQPGTTPTFDSMTRLDGGFSFMITSHVFGQGIFYEIEALSTDGATDPATVSIVRSGMLVTVSGLADGESATIEVTAQRYGYTHESAQISGQALSPGTAPTLSAATRTPDGFHFTITNYDDQTAYLLAIDPASVAISRMGDLVTVSGLEPAALGTATVTARNEGYLDASADRSGNALDAGVAAEFAVPEWTNDGWTVVISNWDVDVTYTPALVSPGHGAVALVGDTITVSGLDPEEEATVSVLAEHPDRPDASSSVTSAAPPWEDGNLDDITDYIQPWVVKVSDAGGVKIYLETDPVNVCEISSTPADWQHEIRVRVTASRADFDPGEAFSEAVVVTTLAILDAPDPGPELVGDVETGATLSIDPGVWESAGVVLAPDFTYQWYRVDGGDEEPIEGATGEEYTLVTADLGFELLARVTATTAGFHARSADTSPVGPVVEGQMPAGTSGLSTLIPRVGSAVTVLHEDDWPEGTTFSYVWGACTAEGSSSETCTTLETPIIEGATEVSYTPDEGRLGRWLHVRIIASAPGYLNHEQALAIGQVIGPIVTGAVSIGGTVAVGHTVTAEPDWDQEDATTTGYQWVLDGAEIDGATSAELELLPTHLGGSLSVEVTATKDGFDPGIAESAAVVVAAGSFEGMVAVSGTAAVGETLTIEDLEWSIDSVTVEGYRWYSDDEAIPGAEGASLVIAPDRAGTRIHVAVTGSAVGYANAEAISSQTALVALGSAPGAPTPPAFDRRRGPGRFDPQPRERGRLGRGLHGVGIPLAGRWRSHRRCDRDNAGDDALAARRDRCARGHGESRGLRGRCGRVERTGACGARSRGRGDYPAVDHRHTARRRGSRRHSRNLGRDGPELLLPMAGRWRARRHRFGSVPAAGGSRRRCGHRDGDRFARRVSAGYGDLGADRRGARGAGAASRAARAARARSGTPRADGHRSGVGGARRGRNRAPGGGTGTPGGRAGPG